jgi:hypothetical protein
MNLPTQQGKRRNTQRRLLQRQAPYAVRARQVHATGPQPGAGPESGGQGAIDPQAEARTIQHPLLDDRKKGFDGQWNQPENEACQQKRHGQGHPRDEAF